MADTNITNIPAPRVPFIDERTGTISREWYRFLFNIFGLTGSGTNVTSLTDLQYAPATVLTGANGTVTGVTATSPVVSSGGIAPNISMPAATTSVNGYLTSTDWTTFNNKGSGTVTAVSVASANGLAGTSSGGATPALTLSTSITGVLKGNGTAISAATSGTDYAPATSGSSILYGNAAGGFSNVTIGTGVAFAGGTLSATGSGGTVTSVTGTAPVVSSGGATPAISMPAATTSVNGYLTSTDWTTFNNKGSGTVTSVSGTAGRVTSTGGATPVIDLASGVATPGTTGSASLIPVVTIDTYGRVTGITTAANPQGTVTAVSVVSANGLAGTSSGGATPAITLSTSITGVLKGNGTAISAAVSGTDYAPATSGSSILYGNSAGGFSNVTVGTGLTFVAGTLASTASGGTVTTVSFTGGIITVANPTTTPALTVAGTSGGIPYFSSASTWASSAALAANALVVGGGAGATPATVTTGTGVVTALGVNTGSSGAFVVNGGALGTPSSGTVTNLTGTAGINITGTAPAGTLTGTTLSSGVTASSLTSVGTSLTINSISVTPAEGTWTPTDASGASLSFSGVYALGKYKKVGAIVWFSFQVLYPATASAAAATIGGLPFTPANTGPDNVTGAMQTNGSTAALLTVNSGAANIALQIASTGVQFTNVQLSTIFVRGSGFYFTT
ncbi:hypothetical protein UFOVP839_18 [uncultured Caudovirales phage]|uniref:Uncharacterized protein n=2 Tax=uncultured Caudovirales phage TaxID=2100421 RepID=A0A6J5QIT9_9CAUD|nr:hypothetical protein UFOVP839_18 [uncultured Caudovirales phage]CAB4183662.1 hypothetical protein UFOVP1100_51 [uncultured Caudovirales phage]CAB4219336.1 hypothetical protein UFOVP1612_49 [uncultured Caudovirales phage]